MQYVDYRQRDGNLEERFFSTKMKSDMKKIAMKI